MPVPLVDSHCHLPLIERGPRSMDEFLAETAAAGVSHILCVAVDLPSYPGVLALAEQHPNVYATVGVHPNSERAHEPDVAQLVALAAHPRVVGIGETGLDFYRQHGDVEWQYERFRVHIRAAIECGKPLVIHTRDSAAATVEVLRAERAERIGGVMHCFVEDWETARAAMDLGFYISFSGIVTFKTATALQDVAKRVPLERLLVETDAPWLAPVPKRGKQNEPAYVRHTAEFLARLRGEPFEHLAAVTTANFFRLFSSAV
ncbi:MAG: TatD family hydrolase [Gammaproteobacteria bacterium]|nr:TatD family hydrolase [Gammaproteobacteria bacterium]MBI5614774.1 TatD family hydrolase [Gammaproteobacteria bacterium]